MRNKRIVIGTTQGYSLKSRFYSLSQLCPCSGDTWRPKDKDRLPIIQ